MAGDASFFVSEVVPERASQSCRQGILSSTEGISEFRAKIRSADVPP